MISILEFLRFGLRLYIRMILLPTVHMALPKKDRSEKKGLAIQTRSKRHFLVFFLFSTSILLVACPKALSNSPYAPTGTSETFENTITNTTHTAVYAGSFGQPGTAVGLFFSTLSGILVNQAGTVIYTSEMPAAALNKRVQRFAYDGVSVTPTHFSNNILGNIRTLVFNPAGTHVCGLDSTGRLYSFAIANLFTPTLAQPAITFTIGTGIGEVSSSGSGQPSSFGCVFDSTGRFWVADTGVARVQCFTNTNTPGFYSFINNAPSGAFSTFNLPYCIQNTPEGNLAIVDTLNNRIVVVTEAGQVVKQFGNVNSTAVATPGGFNRPAFVAVNSYGQFLVTDILNSRVQRYD
ncbi:MAG: hypothetical protein JNM63_02875, partial [Spirochaetia bacterium]|nr:hypothetical protein [Spirochaetia bacterium]